MDRNPDFKWVGALMNNVHLGMSFRRILDKSVFISLGLWTLLILTVFFIQSRAMPDGQIPLISTILLWLSGLPIIGFVQAGLVLLKPPPRNWIISSLLGVILSILTSLLMTPILNRSANSFQNEPIPPEKETIIVEDNGVIKKITTDVGIVKKVVSYDLIWIYLLASGIVMTTFLVRENTRQKLQQYKLKEQLTDAELRALRAQLNPHFLFNALNTVSALIEEDAGEAQSALEEFSYLLRDMLERGKESFVSVETELEFIQRYLSVEGRRFDLPFKNNVNATDEAMEARIPSMILQPLVENAVKHGVVRGGRGGREVRGGRDGRADQASGMIRIEVKKMGEELDVQILDKGPGLSENPPIQGNGLSITQNRLRGLYGNNYTLQFKEREGGGLLVVLRIPFQFINQDS